MVIWPWSWIFQVKFWKCCISWMEGPIDMERKGCESTGCYTHFPTFDVPLTHDLDFGFSRSNFEQGVSQEWVGHRIKVMWIDRMLDPCCDFQCPPHTWLWPSIFKVKFWKSCISGMGGPIDMEWKRVWVDRMLHPLCDFQIWPQPWPWPWIFKVKFWKSRISGIEWPIDMVQKGYESIER